MKCPKCNGLLRVVDTVQAGDHALTQTMRCTKCKTRAMSVCVLSRESPKDGQGALAMAARLKVDAELLQRIQEATRQ